MRKTLLLIMLAAIPWLMSKASPTHPEDSISSTYHKGVFHTHVTRMVTATPSWRTAQMADSLVEQFLRDPELLYDWALKGTGQQHDGSEKDDIILVLKNNNYNPKAHRSILTFDVVVPGFRTIKDVVIESVVTNEKTDKYSRTIIVDMHTSLVLKHAHGVLTIKEINTAQSLITMDVDIKFGWFFNLFITQKKYKALAEFRLGKFVDNLRFYSARPEFYVSHDQLQMRR